MTDIYNLLGDPATKFAGHHGTRTVYDSFGAWVSGWFAQAEADTEAVAGVVADADDDGVLNLMEYALNLNPRTAVAEACRCRNMPPPCAFPDARFATIVQFRSNGAEPAPQWIAPPLR